MISHEELIAVGFGNAVNNPMIGNLTQWYYLKNNKILFLQETSELFIESQIHNDNLYTNYGTIYKLIGTPKTKAEMQEFVNKLNELE